MAIKKIQFRKTTMNGWVMEAFDMDGKFLSDHALFGRTYRITISKDGFGISDPTTFQFNPTKQQLHAFAFPDKTPANGYALGHFQIQALNEPAKDRAGTRNVLRAIGTADIADIGIDGNRMTSLTGPIHYQVLVNDDENDVVKKVLVHMDANYEGTLIVVTNSFDLQIRRPDCKCAPHERMP